MSARRPLTRTWTSPISPSHRTSTRNDSDGGADPADVVAAFVCEAEIAPSVGEAIERARSAAAPEDAVLVTGSLFTVADAKRALQR